MKTFKALKIDLSTQTWRAMPWVRVRLAMAVELLADGLQKLFPVLAAAAGK